MIVTNARWDAVDAECMRRRCTKRTAKACGRDVAVLASSSSGGKLPGERRRQKSRSPARARYKPSTHCAGKAGMLPLNLYARVRHFYTIAHETAGAARTRSSLRPLNKRG